MTNATYKLLTKLSKMENGASFEEMLSWNFFRSKAELEYRISVLADDDKMILINDGKICITGPGEEALRAERYLRESHFIAWGTLLTAAASFATSVVTLFLSR